MNRRAEAGRGFETGVLAGAGATLASFACRALWGMPMPQEVLAERIVRLLPNQVFTLLLAELQHAAKPAGFALALLLSFAGFGLGGAAFACLLRTRSRPRFVLALGTAAATWATLAYGVLPFLEGEALGEPLTTAIPPWTPSLAIASLVYACLLAYSLGGAPARSRSFPGPASIGHGENAPAVGAWIRRRVLLRRSAIAIALAAGAASGRFGSAQPERRPRAVAAAFGGGTSSPAPFHLIRGMPTEVTPNGRFYQVSKNYPFDPVVDQAAWSLKITGLVSRPLTFSYAELLAAAPALERYQTLECIGNPVGGDLIGTARWKGVRVRDLLALAEARPRATAVVWRSADGYSEAVPFGVAMDSETLLAYAMNGRPLTRQHGAPLRVLLPNRYGMKQPKWLVSIEVGDAAELGRWERLRFNNPAFVKTHSACLVAAQGAGSVDLGGWAFAGNRGIAAVEVSADGGGIWFPASVKPALGASCWQLWSADWTPPAPGEYVVSVRARDGTGRLQPGRWRRMPDGAEGYHEVRVRVPG